MSHFSHDSHDAARENLRYRNCTFVNGTIYTGGTTPTVVPCLAVRDGVIAYAGSYADLPAELHAAEQVDLRGRMIVPGFTDSHAHPVEGFQLTCDADLGDAHSLDAIAHQVRECAALHPQRSWVMAGNVALEALGAQLNRSALDMMVGDRPLLLIGHDVHSGCLNTAALRVLGVSATTPDPEGGIYERDAHGAPTGVVHEAALYGLFRHLPQMGADESARALQKAQRQAHENGITGWFEAMVGQRLVDAYVRARDSGNLKANVSLGLLVSPNLALAPQIGKLIDWRRQYDGGRVRLHTAKIFIDGVLESHTGALLDNYADVDHNGAAHWTPAQLHEAVFAADAAGFDLHFHTIGDRAVRMALDTLEALNRERGRRDRRAQLAHVQLIDPLDVPRFAETGAIASVQAVWGSVAPGLKALYTQLLGERRMSRQYAFGDLQRGGAMLSGGSDWPVSTQNPLVAIETALRRAAPGDVADVPFLPEQSVGVEAMLKAYTHNSAFSLRFDGEAGVLAVGRPASLAVLSGDVRDVAPHRVAEVQVGMTLFEGERVFGGVE
ncbi:amidohydrolase [Paraburkholderia sp. BCC1876]|uniref:amidohydrolase n=1 Tax=Paraburkholderia sp. BCC1876 TaxID=2676303 RepID=UPI00158FD9FE|nr:amidohydrolase [Paraburkholderia sp. BCC1876]